MRIKGRLHISRDIKTMCKKTRCQPSLDDIAFMDTANGTCTVKSQSVFQSQ